MSFELGNVVMTRGVADEMAENEMFAKEVHAALGRYQSGDWGDMDEEDMVMNDMAVTSGEDRIFAAYNLSSGERVWIITEWDRSCSTILFPEEY